MLGSIFSSVLRRSHMENEVPFLSGTSGCASWRPLASVHGCAGTQSRAEPHLVLSYCHYCASAEATLCRVPACCIEPCGDSRLAWEGSVIWLSLHTSGRGSEAARFLLITCSLCPWNKSRLVHSSVLSWLTVPSHRTPTPASSGSVFQSILYHRRGSGQSVGRIFGLYLHENTV